MEFNDGFITLVCLCESGIDWLPGMVVRDVIVKMWQSGLDFYRVVGFVDGRRWRLGVVLREEELDGRLDWFCPDEFRLLCRRAGKVEDDGILRVVVDRMFGFATLRMPDLSDAGLIGVRRWTSVDVISRRIVLSCLDGIRIREGMEDFWKLYHESGGCTREVDREVQGGLTGKDGMRVVLSAIALRLG